MESNVDLGSYILLQIIGQGNFSKVKLAEHKETHQRYAVKIIKKSKLEENPELSSKIQREIALMKILDHTHIIKLIEIAESPRHLFIIQEYAENGELFDYLVARRYLSVEESMRIFRQIIYGLDYLHSRGICHRDLKPENLLLDSHNNVKIADFGFARWLKYSTTQTSCGSPHYAAPEVIRGIPYNGQKADIWSCGVILYALLAGRLPFNEPNFKDLVSKIKNGQYRMPDFPAVIKDLVAKMLCVNPECRITIEQIKHHKAFRIGLPQFYTPPLPFPMPDMSQPVSIDDLTPEVKETMITIGFTPEELNEQLSLTGCNTAKSFYSILTQTQAIESFPWTTRVCITDENNISLSNGTNFSNTDNPLSKEQFYKFQRSNSNIAWSIESPIQSMADVVLWSANSQTNQNQKESEVVVNVRYQLDSAVANIQKHLSDKQIDWLFPQDQQIFAKLDNTIVSINLIPDTDETSVISMSIKSGAYDKFNSIVDDICTCLDAHRFFF
ncbi:CAMK family protein kinase [Trichomonas vaginalis G3]|uniref:CAMK family protein kinase n=1 Tax=Trichomonas vaginalis (strain ATCC PRA-98 / G3) TaxID=412133 RepID=A2FK34_TRIV3|nr:protein serine/threonine kinase protein [Trichomonas vaginalis G3]EAX94743.1 CAMK family protein kinase [Trichomonas vaginalis G3]KAI5551719.1 protein serine/threonine kinase protein [Trichomonas vaginalis G3]|eukprot:XP_001307673.1 CAMK family protein kinase [Trichomonas vaginalis G3]